MPPEPRILTLHGPGGARARLHPQGAHLLDWFAPGEACSRLFLSERAVYRPGVAIRGGVPLIFPQFSDRGPLPRHGFARTADWQLSPEGPAQALARWMGDARSQAQWPAAGFEACFTVQLEGGALRMELGVQNTGDAPFTFTAALHSYLAVQALGEARLLGLQGRHYQDSAAGGGAGLDTGAALRFDGTEVDRIYLDTPRRLWLEEGGRRLRIDQSGGFHDTVVWNPGERLAAGLPDLAPGEAQRFLCVEAAVIARPVTLVPGQDWRGGQTLTAL